MLCTENELDTCECRDTRWVPQVKACYLVNTVKCPGKQLRAHRGLFNYL